MSYLDKARLSLLGEEYKRALDNTYKISEINYKPESFIIDRIRAIAYSKLHRIDSALVYANKAISQTENNPLSYEMIEIYGVLAWNYLKLDEVDIVFKYCNLTLQAIRLSNLSEIEKVKLMRGYRLAAIVEIKTSRDREGMLKNSLIFIIIGSLIVISLLIIYSTRKRKKLKLKLELFKYQLEQLKEANSIKKEKGGIVLITILPKDYLTA